MTCINWYSYPVPITLTIMATKKRRELTLKDKIDLIKKSDGKSSRQLAEIYGVGRTQVQNILKRKRELTEQYEENANDGRKRQCVSTGNDKLNDVMWQWFNKMRAQLIPVSGPMIQEKALAIAKELGLPEFKASNGWLRSFKDRHNIAGARVCGESGSVDSTTVADWQEKLPSIIDGYSPSDIFNMDETGVFYRQMPVDNLNIHVYVFLMKLPVCILYFD